ncbi:MAG: hypothetical protein ACYC1E_11795 [Propionibacteriaceae bacterium]
MHLGRSLFSTCTSRPPLLASSRGAVRGQTGDSDVALAWCVGILVVAYALAMVTFRRRIG